MSTVDMKSQIGMEIRSVSKTFHWVEIREYRCTRPFADIREDEIVYAGHYPGKNGMTISHERWEDTVIGFDVFYDHFEMETNRFPPVVTDEWVKMFNKLPKKVYYK